MSGFAVPKFVAKSRFLWNEPMWPDYNKIWLSSKTPTSDMMVEKELDRLEYILGLYPNATLAGQSLGGWWLANLALRPNIAINKLVLWTPLCDCRDYPIFNVTERYNPAKQIPNGINYGFRRVLVLGAKNDLIVPSAKHSWKLSDLFGSITYYLNGGHFYQNNHQSALTYMKEWINL